jgi:hypothetical protein
MSMGPKHADQRPRSRFARERLGYKTSEEAVCLDRMPLNATGKGNRIPFEPLAEARPQGEKAVLRTPESVREVGG